LLARLEAVEARLLEASSSTSGSIDGSPSSNAQDEVAELRRRLEERDAELTSVREENVTVKAQNLLVLAAAKEQAKAMDAMEEAQKYDERARRSRRKAASAARRASAMYQDAVSHGQLPGSPRDLPPAE
jgi:hypothetical protein